MVRVGIVGIGFMGMVHYLSYAKARGVKVVALSEVDKKRLAGDWRGIKGNFGPEGTQMDLSGIATYDDMHALFADPKVDLVDICLPPSFHADAAVAALKAGKDVFCEKPMALDTAGTQKMSLAAAKAKRLLMVGHVLPLFPEYEFAHQLATSGKYGKLLGGTFKRVISDPQWLPNYYHPDRIGGPMLDLHVHDAHFIRLMFGMPKSVFTQGRMRGEVVEYFHSQFQFENPSIVVHATSGVINQQGRSFVHGYEIHFERATIAFEFAVIDDEPRVLLPVTVMPAKGKVQTPKLGSGDPMDAFLREVTAVAKAVTTRKPPEFLMGDLARDAITLCHKQTESAKKGKPVRLT